MHQCATSTVEQLASAGLRRTKALYCLLALFDETHTELFAHSQIDDYLRAQGVRINRVTLYRLRDRLVAAGVLGRVVDHGRVFRYGLAARAVEDEAGQLMPHLECDQCHRQFWVSALPDGAFSAIREALIACAHDGHQGLCANIAIRGVCARCMSH